MWRSWVWVASKALIVSLSKKLYPYCLVLVGSRNGLERDITIKLKQIEGLMEDWLKCQISPLVEYRQKGFIMRYDVHDCKKHLLWISQTNKTVQLVLTVFDNITLILHNYILPLLICNIIFDWTKLQVLRQLKTTANLNEAQRE